MIKAIPVTIPSPSADGYRRFRSQTRSLPVSDILRLPVLLYDR
jgi:hypothetical protein